MEFGDGNIERFRNVLVVTQFTISIALIVGTVIIFYQLNYMKHKNLGFGKEHIAVVRILGDSMRQ